MILLGSIIFLSIISTGLYVYFFEYLDGKNLIYTIPIVFILAILCFVLLFILFLTISLLFRSKENTKPSKFYFFLTTQVAVMLSVIFGVRIVSENLELLPKNNKFFLISNHQSLHDPIAIIGYLRKYKISYIMKDGIMKIPFVGKWLRATGFLPIDRKNDRNALKTILTAIKKLEDGSPIGVYPEGTRSGSSEINSFRNGVFKIPQKAEAPIVVCLIDNFYSVKNRFPFRRTKVLFKVCKVIQYEEFKDMQTNDIGNMCRDILLENQKEARSKYSFLK